MGDVAAKASERLTCRCGAVLKQVGQDLQVLINLLRRESDMLAGKRTDLFFCPEEGQW